MLDLRLKSLEVYNKLPIPDWGPSLDGLDLDNIITYVKPKTALTAKWSEVPNEIKETFEKLGIPQLCYVEEIRAFGDGKVTVRRAIEGGYEVLESPTPALLTVVEGNDPRPMGARRIMKYKRAKTPSEVRRTAGDNAEAEIAALRDAGLLIGEWSAADSGADPARIGLAGSPTKVKQVSSVVLTAGESKSVEPTAAGIAELMHELISDHTLG